MKKKIILFMLVVAVAFAASYGLFCLKQNNARKEFLSDLYEAENPVFIHNSNTIKVYTEQEISELELVESGEVSEDDMKEAVEEALSIVKSMCKELQNSDFVQRRNIENEEAVAFGFVLEDGQFMYIYENGTVMLKRNGKYYVFEMKNYEHLKEYYSSVSSYDDVNPYIIFS